MSSIYFQRFLNVDYKLEYCRISLLNIWDIPTVIKMSMPLQISGYNPIINKKKKLKIYKINKI